MTDFEKTYQNYNPRAAALAEARALLTEAAKAAMADGTLAEAELPAFIVEIPADTKNGDIASNLAMAGARTWRKAPKMIADALLAHLPSIEHSVFAKVEVAGPGFINLFLAPSFWASVVLGACSNKEYGRTDHGKGAKYNVEFVSANPTGPMHMGNARGGALGDCLAAVLDWSGYDVTREFYINDAGNQIQKFGKSLAVRYLQQFCGEEAYPLPAECYQGGDIKVLAGEFAEINGDKYVAACSGLDEEALFASEAFETLEERSGGLRPAQEHCRPQARPGQVPHRLRCLVPREHPARIRRCPGCCEQTAGSGSLLQSRGWCHHVPQRPVCCQVRHREQEKRPRTAPRRKPRTKSSSAQTASPPTSPPTLPTTTTSWPPAALPRPLMSGVPTTTATLPA